MRPHTGCRQARRPAAVTIAPQKPYLTPGESLGCAAETRTLVNSDIQNPFSDLGLLPAIVRATADESYSEPTPVQREVIPAVIAGRDVLACAQTGTGKTAAFVLPILHQLAQHARGTDLRVLILTPRVSSPRKLPSASRLTDGISACGTP